MAWRLTTISGREILTSAETRAVAMVIHELVTNAERFVRLFPQGGLIDAEAR
jgi:two-component sensor histidine kinase